MEIPRYPKTVCYTPARTISIQLPRPPIKLKWLVLVGFGLRFCLRLIEFMQWWYSEKSAAPPVSSRSARGNGTAAAHSPAMNGTKATSREQQGPPRLARGHSLDIQPQNRLVEPPVPASSYPAVSAADFDPDSWNPFPSQSSPIYETYDAASMPVMQHLVPSAHVQSSADGWAAVQAARRQQNAKRVIEEKFRLLHQTCQELQQAMMELLDDPSHLRHAAL